MNKIWAISDTHGRHRELYIPDNIDMVIFAGDATNSKSPDINTNEMLDFIDWFSNLNIRYKIFVAGNHDTSIAFNRINIRTEIVAKDIIYLEHNSIVVAGIKIFGSPYTPTFGTGWAFNKDRAKLFKLWEMIPYDTDILITHGPPLGILDHTYSNGKDENGERVKGSLNSVGCRSLRKVVSKIKPSLMIFGHLHDEEDVDNAGLFVKEGTTFANVSVVDLKRNLKNNGEIIIWDTPFGKQ